MGTVRFILRTTNVSTNSTVPIQGIYSLEGQRRYFRTKQKIRVANWNEKAQAAIYLDKQKARNVLPDVPYNSLPTAKEVEILNSKLFALKMEVRDLESLFELNGVTYSSQMLVDSLNANKKQLTKKEAPANELIAYLDKYIDDHKETRAAGSLSVYRALKVHLVAFKKHSRKSFSFETIDYNFFQDFQTFLLSIKKKDINGLEYLALNNTTVAKQLSTVKTFLSWVKRQGISISDRYKEFPIKKENLEVIALTSEEFELLYSYDLRDNKRLDQVRDTFCFACVTGLRISDIQQLKREHIKKDEIRLIVTKTKEPLLIPLNLYSSAILSKYAHLHKPLPVISNQRTNDYIHELCKKVGIDDEIEIVRFRGAKRETKTYPKYSLISFHTGRKTFCTLSLEKGMSAEEVMTISGHRDYRSFSRYVKITEKRSKFVMSKAWGVLQDLTLANR